MWGIRCCGRWPDGTKRDNSLAFRQSGLAPDDITSAMDQCYRAVDRSLVKAARSGDIKSRKAQYAKEWSA